MKLNQKVLALSLATVGGAYYVICALAIYIAPDLYKSIATSWAHGTDLAQIWVQNPPEIGKVLWGFITFTGASWITGFTVAWGYNYFSKTK